MSRGWQVHKGCWRWRWRWRWCSGCFCGARQQSPRRCGRRQAQAQRRIVQSTAASWRSSSELHCPLPITPSRPLSPPRSPPHAPSSTPISLRTPPQTRRLNLSHGLVGGAVQPPRRCGRGPDGAAAARAVQRRPRPVAQVCPAPSCPSAALLASSLVCGHTG